jgi:hypothetical protein
VAPVAQWIFEFFVVSSGPKNRFQVNKTAILFSAKEMMRRVMLSP